MQLLKQGAIVPVVLDSNRLSKEGVAITKMWISHGMRKPIRALAVTRGKKEEIKLSGINR